MYERILYRSCPLCDSIEIFNGPQGDCSKHDSYNQNLNPTIQWMDCLDCEHQFASGYYSNDTLNSILSKTVKKQTVGYEIERQRNISSKIIDKVIPFKSDGIWLDVGFGNGSLIFTAEEYGFEVIGVDLRHENVDKMKKLGYEAYCDLVENLKFKRKLSVVSMMDVLEHIPDPKQVLSFLNKNMSKDACLLLSMPNKQNILWKLLTLQSENPYFGELEHYHNFSRTSLYYLLESCGFTPVSYGVSERYRCCMEIIATKKNIN